MCGGETRGANSKAAHKGRPQEALGQETVLLPGGRKPQGLGWGEAVRHLGDKFKETPALSGSLRVRLNLVPQESSPEKRA